MRFPTPVFAPDAPTSPAPGGGAGAASSTVTPTTSTEASTGSPATQPSEPDSPSTDVTGSSSFEFMFGTEGGDPLEGPGSSPLDPATPEPKPVQPTPAEPAKPVAPVTEPAKPVPSLATPAQTEPTSPAPATPAAPSLDLSDPGTLARHLADNEEQVVQQLSDTLFKLSDKDVEALEADTVGTIPKLLAKVFVQSQRNFLMQMAQIVPRMVQTHGEVTKRHTEAEGEFYAHWTDLKPDQQVTLNGKTVPMKELVRHYAVVYRQMHPDVSRKDMIEALGPMVMMAAKVVPSVTQNPVAPKASPMTNGSGRPPQPAPFVPAGSSAGGAIPSTAPQLSPVEAMFAGNEE